MLSCELNLTDVLAFLVLGMLAGSTACDIMLWAWGALRQYANG